jgi:hypothetical protein
MVQVIKKFKVFALPILLCTLLAAPACKPYKCPANGGSYKDKDPDRIFKFKRHKPQSGLWPKNMKH